MSAVSQATLLVNAVTVVGQEGVAAGVGVAVQDTEGARAMDGGQFLLNLLPFLVYLKGFIKLVSLWVQELQSSCKISSSS